MLGTIRMVLAVVAAMVEVAVAIMDVEGADDTVAVEVAKNRAKRFQLGDNITLIW